LNKIEKNRHCNVILILYNSITKQWSPGGGLKVGYICNFNVYHGI